MHVEVGGYVSVNVPEKGQDIPDAGDGVDSGSGRYAGGHVQRGKQRSGPVSDVVVRHPLDVQAQSQRQQRLCPFQGLDLGLLIEHTGPRVVLRVQI